MQKDAVHRQVAFKAKAGLGNPSSPPLIQIPTPPISKKYVCKVYYWIAMNIFTLGARGILKYGEGD